MTVFYAIMCAVLAIATALAGIMSYRQGVNDGRRMGQNKPLEMPAPKTDVKRTPGQEKQEKELMEALRYIDEYKG